MASEGLMADAVLTRDEALTRRDGVAERRRRRRRLAGRYLLMTMLALIVLFPLYITVVNSLLRPDQIAARPPALFPSDPQWGAYKTAWTDGHMGRYLLNSAIVTTGIVLGQVTLAILAAYA